MALITTLRKQGPRASTRHAVEDEEEEFSPTAIAPASPRSPRPSEEDTNFHCLVKQLSTLQVKLQEKHDLEMEPLRTENTWLQRENVRLADQHQQMLRANAPTGINDGLRGTGDARIGTDRLFMPMDSEEPIPLSHPEEDAAGKSRGSGRMSQPMTSSRTSWMALASIRKQQTSAAELRSGPIRRASFLPAFLRDHEDPMQKSVTSLPAATPKSGIFSSATTADLDSADKPHVLDVIQKGKAMGTSRWLLHPSGKFMPEWDKIVMLSLTFTALISPVEICFYETSCDVSWTFVGNQAVNIVFFVDLILQFFVIYEAKSSEGIRFIRDRRLIAEKYLRSWFTMDLISVIPFDTAGCILNSSLLQKMKVARFIRLVRLLKLVRLMRASRILARWQVHIAFPYTSQTLFKFVIMLIIGAHWMGCIWGLVGLETDGYTWIDNLADGKPDGMAIRRSEDTGERPALNLYLTALYFAIMTITSIGYGDITPQQGPEYIVCILCQMFGGLLWAYGISEVIAVVSNLNPGATAFRRTMDDLNHMMNKKQLEHKMQVRLRSFFLQARELHDAERYHDLLSRMSPQLQGDVARVTNVRWIQRVWYLAPKVTQDGDVIGISDHFVAQIACAFRAAVCSQGESMRADATLRVLTRGLAGHCGRILRAGDVWGEDFILECAELRQLRTTTCLTFIEIQAVTRIAFHNVLRHHGTPQDRKVVRRAVVKLAVIRGVVAQAKKKRDRDKLKEKNCFREGFESSMMASTDFSMFGSEPTSQILPPMVAAPTLPGAIESAADLA